MHFKHIFQIFYSNKTIAKLLTCAKNISTPGEKKEKRTATISVYAINGVIAAKDFIRFFNAKDCIYNSEEWQIFQINGNALKSFK